MHSWIGCSHTSLVQRDGSSYAITPHKGPEYTLLMWQDEVPAALALHGGIRTQLCWPCIAGLAFIWAISIHLDQATIGLASHTELGQWTRSSQQDTLALLIQVAGPKGWVVLL